MMRNAAVLKVFSILLSVVAFAAICAWVAVAARPHRTEVESLMTTLKADGTEIVKVGKMHTPLPAAKHKLAAATATTLCTSDQQKSFGRCMEKAADDTPKRCKCFTSADCSVPACAVMKKFKAC